MYVLLVWFGMAGITIPVFAAVFASPPTMVGSPAVLCSGEGHPVHPVPSDLSGRPRSNRTGSDHN